MDRSLFISIVSDARSSSDTQRDLMDKLEGLDDFQSLIDIIQARTTEWGIAVKLIGEHTALVESTLSPKEAQIKSFFANHSFESTNEQRIVADLIELLSDINATRFIQTNTRSMRAFDSYVVIVPTGNSNSHSYKIGLPIINLSSGRTFFRLDGSSGNDMSTNTTEYRMPSRLEIEAIVIALFKKSMSFVENMVFGLTDS